MVIPWIFRMPRTFEFLKPQNVDFIQNFEKSNLDGAVSTVIATVNYITIIPFSLMSHFWIWPPLLLCTGPYLHLFFFLFFLIAFILGIQTRQSRSSVLSHFNYNYTIHFVGRTVQIRNSLDRLMVKTISNDMCKWYEMI